MKEQRHVYIHKKVKNRFFTLPCKLLKELIINAYDVLRQKLIIFFFP